MRNGEGALSACITAMEPLTVYLIALFACGGALLAWQTLTPLTRRFLNLIVSRAKNRVVVTLLFRRRNGSSNVNALSVIVLCLFSLANLFLLFFGLENLDGLRRRSAILCLTNLVPLYSGSGINIIHPLGYSAATGYSGFAHRWIGRLCAAFGMTHAGLALKAAGYKATPVDISVSASILSA